jgi:Tfp pilus assembly protein PilV
MIEVLVAMVVLVVGILGTIGAFDSARKLDLLSERRTAMAHRAQLEIERLQGQTYSQLAMISAPAHSSEATNPGYYVNYSSPVKCSTSSCYAWDANKPGEEESLTLATKAEECTSLITKECGVISASPTGRPCSEHMGACEWADGPVSGNLYDFITWHTDSVCEKEEAGKKLCATQSYKRITVVVTVKVPSGNHEPSPIRVSTLIAEPSA